MTQIDRQYVSKERDKNILSFILLNFNKHLCHVTQLEPFSTPPLLKDRFSTYIYILINTHRINLGVQISVEQLSRTA